MRVWPYLCVAAASGACLVGSLLAGVLYAGTGGGLVVLAAGTGVLVFGVLAVLSVLAAVDARRRRRAALDRDLAAANEREAHLR